MFLSLIIVLIKLFYHKYFYYSQQKEEIFQIRIDELKTFFRINIVMGYHILIYPDLGVPFIVNFMPMKKILKICSLLNFKGNNIMIAPNCPIHNQMFKFRFAFDHFDNSFVYVISSLAHQHIDKYMIKFKDNNYLKK